MFRVLQVIGSLNNGGSQSMIMNIYRNIDRTRVQFDFVIFHNERFYQKEIEELGGKVYLMQGIEGLRLAKFIRNWKEFLENHQEYIIVHVRSSASIYLSIANKMGRISIAHSHNTSSGKGVFALCKDIMQYPVRYIARDRIACSEDAGRWLFGNEKYWILNNPIDCNKFKFDEEKRNYVRKCLNVSGRTVIVHVGRFNSQKNHEQLVDIYEDYLKVNNQSCLLLIGDGELKKNIENKVDAHGLNEYVKFLGIRTDVADILSASDIFIFPSLHEGLPVSLIEAQANGIPIIASDRVTTDTDVTGLLNFLPIDVEETCAMWTKKISTVLSNSNLHHREEFSERVSNAGFGVNLCKEQLLQHYQMLLDTNGKRSNEIIS